MFARTSTWTGSVEALERWAEQAESSVRPFVASLEGNAGAFFLIDRAAGRALTLTVWKTEEAALASDQGAERSRAHTVATTGVELLERSRYDVVTGIEPG
jgi:heme-degrading monooxygenase HmoA